MNTWADALGELVRRRGRSLLSLLCVAIAVAAVVAVRAATDTTRAAYERVFQALAGSADLEVVASAGARFEGSIGDSLRSLSGVRAVVPVLQQATILYTKGRRLKVLALGIVPDEPESLAGFKLSAGKLPGAADEVMLEASLASSLGIQLGDKVRLLTSRGLRSFSICGLISLENAVRLQQGGMLLASIDQLQTLFRARGRVDALHLFLAPGATAKAVQAEVARVLPERLTVQVPSARSGLAEQTLTLTQVSLNMASALSFTTAVFVVLSVLLMNVAERRRHLSILRAIGATRRQVIGTVCREALLLGLAGTIIGIPVGIFGGRLLMTAMASMLQVTLPETPSLTVACLAGLVLGPALCLLAAWYPARQASRVSPLEGMRPVVTLHPSHGHKATSIAGLLGCAVSTALTIACVRGQASTSVAVLTVILALVSLTLLLPLILAPAVRLFGWPFTRLLGMEGEMAERLVLRHAGRNSITIGVLFIAVAAGVGTSNAVFSITDDIRAWYDRSFTADYMLRTMMPDMTGPDAATMPESLGDEIAALPGVKGIYSLRFLRVEAAGQEAILVVSGLRDEPPAPAANAAAGAVGAALERGEVVVGSVLAHHASLGVGDMLTITLGSASHAFRIGDVVSEYAFGGSILYLNRRVAEQWFPITGIDTLLIKTEHPAPPAIEKTLHAAAQEHGLLLQSFSDLLRMIDATVSGVTSGLWSLLLLGLLVGALGVVNTLTMNVLEQTRELAMLRAIGMRRSQVMKAVVGQAILIGALGGLLGAGAGLILARMINLCLGSIFGRYVSFAVRPQYIAILLAAALGVVILAAFVPARRAARLNPVEAMRLE
jgi:putative ABC transport system permease protein